MTMAAPTLLTTTSGCPTYFWATSATARAIMSVPPPGAKPTITSMGLLGYSWAPTVTAPPRAAHTAARIPAYRCHVPMTALLAPDHACGPTVLRLRLDESE